MAPILYMQHFSGPVRSVLLTAAALGLKLQHKVLDLSKQEHLTESFLKVCVSILPSHKYLNVRFLAKPATHYTYLRR